MTLIRLFSLFSFIAFFALTTSAQIVGDTLVPLRNNKQIMLEYAATQSARVPKNNQRSQTVTRDGNVYRFQIDTMHLPFIDDFSRNKQKTYRTDVLPVGTTTIIDDDFKVNGVYVDTLEAMFDTSYTYTFNGGTNQWDSTANPFVLVVFYEDPQYVNIPTDTDTVWMRPAGSIINNVFVPNSVVEDTLYLNNADTLFNVPDDGFSLWINKYAYINNTFSVNPPTIGVATFDGLSVNGEPYSSSLVNPNAYGSADTLTSKPIYLKTKPAGAGTYNNSDSLYLSFFYQPEGLGERPDPQDSLVLEFFSPTQNRWNLIWFAQGESLKSFEQVMIPINDTNYFQNGFQFRFRNKATITGNLDHWNIDYVRLNNNRSNLDTELDDVAFVEAPPSLIQSYTEMPWSHYKAQANSQMQSSLQTTVRNNSTVPKLVNFTLRVDEQGTNIYTSGITVVPNFFEKTEIAQTFDVAPFEFPSVSTDTAYAYHVKYVLNTTPDVNRDNDTAFYYQQFKSSYAYDDGSAENAYSLRSANAKLAYEFTPTVSQDSLRGVYFYFPKVYKNITNKPFRIKIWSSLSPENLIYESIVQFPMYTGDRDLYTRYELEEPVLINGTFYVGFEQRDPEDIYIGFDANNNNQDKIFYNVGNGWTGTLNEGSLMIRPDFGNGYNPYPVSAEDREDELTELRAFPNPTQSQLTLELKNKKGMARVIHLSGKLVYEQPFSNSALLDVSQWSSGIYFVHITEENGTVYTTKVVVQ